MRILGGRAGGRLEAGRKVEIGVGVRLDDTGELGVVGGNDGGGDRLARIETPGAQALAKDGLPALQIGEYSRVDGDAEIYVIGCISNCDAVGVKKTISDFWKRQRRAIELVVSVHQDQFIGAAAIGVGA